MSRIVLASGSSVRKLMLGQAGLDFDVIIARVDEESVKASLVAEQTAPRDIADVLAELKAEKVARKHPGDLVIGADQILDFQGEVISKPRDLAQAREQLQRLAGKTHKLHAAAVIHHEGRPIWRHVSSVKMTMRPFDTTFLDQYLQDAGPALLSSVGGYQIEGAGLRLFEKIEGPYHAILGLPLIEMLNFLITAGHYRT